MHEKNLQETSRKALAELEEKELSELVLLRHEVALLTREMTKLTSFKNRLLNGMLQGFGVVIGGTVVAWFVITVVVETLKTANYIPIINTVFDSQQARHFLQKLSDLQQELE